MPSVFVKMLELTDRATAPFATAEAKTG